MQVYRNTVREDKFTTDSQGFNFTELDYDLTGVS